jgi:RNA polymerase sigma factor (sigma-70 family)
MATGQISLVLGHLRRLIGPRAVPDQTDVQLLDRFLHLHEEAAFEDLVKRHGPLVLGLCRRVLGDPHDAEDAFQATFLVLARKAGSIRKQQSLGSWLYGVAYRVARKARAGVARRRVWEKPAGVQTSGDGPAAAAEPEHVSASQPDPVAQAMSQEMRAVVDEELQKLPCAYRESLIRCYLQGQTNEEAARALGWPAGSMSRHLTRARELLRERLVRRGIALPTGLTAALITGQLAAASVPAALAKTSTRAALAFAGNPVRLAGVVSPHAAGIAQTILRAMFMTKLKIATVLFLTTGLLAASLGGLWYTPTTAATPADKGASPKKQGAERDGAPTKARNEESHARVVDLRRRLQKPVDLVRGIDQNTPLSDALAFISDHFGVPIIVETDAFKYETMLSGVDSAGDVTAQPVGLTKVSKIPLGTVLRLVLLQVEDATYVVRPEGIVVTTWRRTQPAAWTGAHRRSAPAVSALLEKTPLSEALKDLADQTGINVVLDPRVGDKGITEMSTTLSNVPLDTAVRLLADMADLKVVAMDNVLYVTSPAKARVLQAEQQRRDDKASSGKQPPAEPAKKPDKAKPAANPGK